MLKSWDFVDPKLASKIKLLQNEIVSLQKQRTNLQKDSKLAPQTKQKLLNFNKKNIISNQQLLQKLKDKLAQYFDKQIQVKTKQTFNSQQYDTATNCQIKLGHFLQQSTVDEHKTKQKLNSTRCSIYYPNSNNNNTINISNYLQKLKGNKVKAKTNRNQRKLKQQNKKLQRQLKAQKIQNQWLSYTIQTLMQQKFALQINVEENNQLLDLYKQKMDILSKQCCQLKHQKIETESRYKKQIESLMKDYKNLKQIQEQNKQLGMQRNLLLRRLEKARQKV